MTNEEAARDFAARFDPPLSVAQFQQLHGKPVHNGWSASGMPVTPRGVRLGVTMMAFGNGEFRAFVETASKTSSAGEAGAEFARIFEE